MMYALSFARLLVCGLSFWCLNCSIAVSQQPSPPEKTSAKKQNQAQNQKFDAKKLVESLKNRNSPPKITRAAPDSDAKAAFGENYDFKEQERIDKIVQELAQNADRAWPELVRHLHDNRYAITYLMNDSQSNWSIGELCEQIISDWISQAYYQHLPESARETGQAFHLFGRPGFGLQGGLKSWCEAREKKEVYELQIELCRWAIAGIEDLTDASAEERKAAVKAIDNEIKSLQSNKKAVKVEKFTRSFEAFPQIEATNDRQRKSN